MKYYSTNDRDSQVSLKDAVVKGLAKDRGLFMPEHIEPLPHSFFENIEQMSFPEMAFEVAKNFFGEDVEHDALKKIVEDTLCFDTPLVPVHDNIYALELYHGPTLAFKDVGGRFMARLLNYFLGTNEGKHVNVLVATSGDTGSAVANGFLDVPGIDVFVLYPKGKVSELQEKQFTTLGRNIHAIEIDGTFDDCQNLVKTAFMDDDLNKQFQLTSANSINVARFLPQAFYYFRAWSQLPDRSKPMVVSVPSGNFGNLTAGLFAQKMGLPVELFIAANNDNDIVYNYLRTGQYKPRKSVETIANAMDVGDPSNFARILDLYDSSYAKIKSVMDGARYSDDQIKETLSEVFEQHGYLCDPHGAVAYRALKEKLKEDQVGIFFETAHPAKFIDTVEDVIGKDRVEIPERLAKFLKSEVVSSPLPKDYESFKTFVYGHAK